MFNGQSIAEWIQNNIIQVLVLVVAAGLIAKALKAETRQVITVVGIVLIAFLLIGMSDKSGPVGEWLWGLVS